MTDTPGAVAIMRVTGKIPAIKIYPGGKAVFSLTKVRLTA